VGAAFSRDSKADFYDFYYFYGFCGFYDFYGFYAQCSPDPFSRKHPGLLPNTPYPQMKKVECLA
jgi:hypothetical protein